MNLLITEYLWWLIHFYYLYLFFSPVHFRCYWAWWRQLVLLLSSQLLRCCAADRTAASENNEAVMGVRVGVDSMDGCFSTLHWHRASEVNFHLENKLKMLRAFLFISIYCGFLLGYSLESVVLLFIDLLKPLRHFSPSKVDLQFLCDGREGVRRISGPKHGAT